MSEQLEEPTPIDVPWAGSQWEGHTHDYPATRRKNGSRVCRECGFPDFTPDPEPEDETPEETP